MLKAEELLQQPSRPREANVVWVLDGSELPYFRSQVILFCFILFYFILFLFYLFYFFIFLLFYVL